MSIIRKIPTYTLHVLPEAMQKLMLNDKLDYLQEKVLYFDTNSLIYVDNGTKNVKTGDRLGEMTDKLSGKGITNFVPMGPES